MAHDRDNRRSPRIYYNENYILSINCLSFSYLSVSVVAYRSSTSRIHHIKRCLAVLRAVRLEIIYRGICIYVYTAILFFTKKCVLFDAHTLANIVYLCLIFDKQQG